MKLGGGNVNLVKVVKVVKVLLISITVKVIKL